MDFYQLGLNLRHVNQYDPWHILEGFQKKSYVRTGKHFSKLEGIVTGRAFGGPYQSCSFWHQTQECGVEMFSRLPADNEYYDI